MLATCDTCGHTIDRDLQAAVNLARLSEHASRVEGRPAGSGPVAGRGASGRPAHPRCGGRGDEPATPHSGPLAAGQTGTAPRKGAAA